MKPKKYFLTGELVKATGITKDALFHYEKNGLIKPEIVKENGYRYYTSEQFDLLNAIAILRNVGVGIAEIKMFLEKQSLDSLYDLYDEKEKEIDKSIDALRKTKKILKSRKENIKEIKEAKIGVVTRSYMKEMKIQLSEELINNDEFTFNEAIEDLLLKTGTYFRFNKTGSISIQNPDDDNSFHCKYLYVENKKSKYVKGEGEYLIIYHRGHFGDSYKSYKKLKEYAKENNIEIEEFTYEEIMLENIAMIKNEPFVMKIMAKII